MLAFKAPISNIQSHLLIQLPDEVSKQMPSRGPVMVNGTISTVSFAAPLEPDGAKGHYLLIDQKLKTQLKAGVGDMAEVELTPTKEWVEQPVPPDIKEAVLADEKAEVTWKATTPAARWEWVRWIRSTNNEQTRKKRIRVACSKLGRGERRPCCFNSGMCTDPTVSKSGLLLKQESAS